MVGLRHGHLHHSTSSPSSKPQPLHYREEQKGRVEKLEGFRAFACFAFGRTNRFDPIDTIPPPKGSAQKQQTHLNHVVLILREIAPPSCAAGDTNLRRGGNGVWLHARRQINIPPSLEAAATTHRCGPRLRADARLGKLPLTIHHPCVHSRRHEPTRAPAPETLHRRRPPPTPLLCSSLLLSSPFSNLRPIMHACRYASQTTDSRAPTE
jgi:hypothetical protein